MLMSNARMILRVVAGILGLVAIVEGWYIFSLRNQVNRFHLMDDSGYVAFDRVSGQLCKTFQLNLAKSSVSANAARSNSGDPILDAIGNAPSSSAAAADAQLDFVRRLPACVDVR
jgi:hypothetical protein